MLLKCVSIIFGATMLQCHVLAADKASNQIMSAAEQFAAQRQEPLKPFYKALYAEGEWNAVLNFNYLGLAAMSIDDYPTAERAFDEAITRIEAIYANDPNAKKAKSLYNEEKVKDFKGEPYERAMTYYYRGILYLRSGDYQNARAMFLAAERHDSFSELEEFQSDFGLMNYLAAWSSYCDNDESRASELYELSLKADQARLDGIGYSHAYIGLIDDGLSPVKIGEGKYKEQLKMIPATQSFEVVAASANVPLIGGGFKQVADVDFQATTRGGRPVEAILKGKAQFKEVTSTVSNVAGQVGANLALQGAYSGSSDMANAGLAGLGISVVSGIFSAATTPAADVRYWASLPSSIYMVASDTLPSEIPKLSFDFGTKKSSEPAQSSTSVINAKNGKCSFSWGRTHSGLSMAGVSHPIVKETNRIERNKAFRAQLESTFAPQSGATIANAAGNSAAEAIQ